jgi:hypothetical protein
MESSRRSLESLEPIFKLKQRPISHAGQNTPSWRFETSMVYSDRPEQAPSKGSLMSPEERDDLMNFILQSQSNAAQEHRKAMERMAEFEKDQKNQSDQIKAVSADLKAVSAEIQALASVSRDLVEVARIHARRLDRLENLNP